MSRFKFWLVIITFVLSLVLTFSAIAAENSTTITTTLENILEDDEKEFQDAELEQDAGITPDSQFYFIDEFFDRFGGDLENREEKVAEIKAMVQAGRIDDAKIALKSYKEYAERVEEEVEPQQQQDARRGAVAIKKVIEEIQDDIPAEEKEDFQQVIESEGRISAAAKIADSIKRLCEALSQLDPEQYAQVCKIKDDDLENAPKWQQRLDKKLTKEQEQEAEKFFKTMSHCFKNPANCKCEEISLTAFAEKCKEVAPLAAQCEEGDEQACDKMDEQTEDIEDLLPPHLQHVLAQVEEEFGDAEFDNHMPPECREAGINFKDRDARQQCMKVMFKVHAPEECVQALETGKIDISNEREAREACERIMFEANAPQECIDAGLKDHRECGKYMFQQNAPEECTKAGLTGESPKDHRKCEEIMRSLEKERRSPEGEGGRGPAFGRNCRDIQDVNEKLQCLEEFYNAAQQHGEFPGQGMGPGGFRPDMVNPENLPSECRDAGATTPEDCGRIMRERFERRGPDEGPRHDPEFPPGEQPPFQPPQMPPGEFPPDQQVPFPPESQLPPGEGFPVPPDQQTPPPSEVPSTPPSESPPSSESPPPSDSGSPDSGSGGSSGESSGGSSSDGGSSGGEGSGSSGGESSSSSGDSGITGSVIGVGKITNRFLEYYFGLQR